MNLIANVTGRKANYWIFLFCFVMLFVNYMIYRLISNSRNHRQSKAANGFKEDKIDISRRQARSESEMKVASTDKFVTTSAWLGRLGNQLFIYAAILGTSYKLGNTPYVRQKDPTELLKYIEVKQSGSEDPRNLKMFSEAGCCAYDPRIENLSSETNYTLAGYFQSWKYFAGAETYVRQNIKFRPSFLAAAREFLQKLNTTKMIFVGVHVRRGDKTNRVESKRGNSVAGTEYILKAMGYFQDLLGNRLTYVIVSDDKKWCSENLNGNTTVQSPFDDPGVDLAILSLCDHVIITSGTYGWWGAWLSGGKTVFYNGFPRPESWLASITVKGDYYPLHWIGMS